MATVRCNPLTEYWSILMRHDAMMDKVPTEMHVSAGVRNCVLRHRTGKYLIAAYERLSGKDKKIAGDMQEYLYQSRLVKSKLARRWPPC